MTDSSAMPTVSRLLIRTPNWLGDAVMALPAMSVLRRAWPAATIAVAAPASIAPLFAEATIAGQDEILVVSGKADAAILRRARVDAAVLLPNSFRSAWDVRRAGIAARWGYAAGLRGPLLTRAVAPPAGRVHQSDYYLHLARELAGERPAEPSDATPITVNAESRLRAGTVLEREGVAADARIVGFAPGAAYGHAKRWPPARVAAVATRLAHERGIVSVLVGAGADRDAGREIESTLPPGVRVVNLIGRTDLRVLAGVLARCAAFVSNDSGAMHLAAAIGVPVVAVFGPTDERATAPQGNHGQHDVLTHPVFCRPCMLRDCPIDHRCMKGITPDAVVAAVTRRIEATP